MVCVCVCGRPQPGDTPVFSRLGPGGGMFPCAPNSSLDTRMAEFQRFEFWMSEWPAFGPAPTGRYARIPRAGASRGYTSLSLISSLRFRNGHFPTICDSRIELVCVLGWLRLGDMPVSCGWVGGSPPCSESFTQCIKRSCAIHDAKRRTVRIPNGLCGFLTNRADS